MSTQRTHVATTSDGITVGGRVHGEGPPLVFLQGVVGDCDIDWQALLPHLTDRFTCHLMSIRGRGLSGDHPDLSWSRLADDVVTYADSIGEPVGIVGWSLGAGLSLTAASQSGAVGFVAPFEPGMMSLLNDEEQLTLGAAVGRTGELAAGGDLTAAVRAFLGFPFHDDEIAVAENAGYVEAASRYVPNMLSFFQQAATSDGPAVDEAAMLGAISVPVVLLQGTNTKPFFTRSARFVADHVPNARIDEIPGAGHAAPLTHPQALAEAITESFSSAQRSA